MPRIDAVVVAPKCPEWAMGRVIEVDGKKFILVTRNPTLVWPRWYNRLGKLVGWQWLYQTWGVRDWFKRRQSNTGGRHGT